MTKTKLVTLWDEALRRFGNLRVTIVTLWDEDLRFSLMCMLLLLTLVLGIFVGERVEKNTQMLRVKMQNVIPAEAGIQRKDWIPHQVRNDGLGGGR